MHNSQLITTAEAAQILRCVPENVRKLAREDKLPVAVVVGRGQRLYERDQVQRMADARARAANGHGV